MTVALVVWGRWPQKFNRHLYCSYLGFIWRDSKMWQRDTNRRTDEQQCYSNNTVRCCSL